MPSLNFTLLIDVTAYAQPGSFTELASKGALFNPLVYSYTESSARLPLYVVVDAHTWSSAEYFPFLLQDNHAATILGEVTGGAGCGFTKRGNSDYAEEHARDGEDA